MLSNFHSGSKTASSSVFSRNFQTSARLSGGAAAYSSNANNSRRNSWTPGSFQNDEVEVSADLQELIKKFTSIKDPTYQLVKIFGPAINFTEPSAVGSVSAKDKFKIHDHRKSWFGGSFPTDTDEPVGNESAVKDNSAEKIEKKKSLEDILKKFVIEKIKPNLTLFSDEIFFSPDATNYSYFVGCNKELIKTLPIEAHFFTKAGLIWNHLDNETKQKFYIAAKAHEDQLFCDQLHRRRIKSLQEETSVPEHQNDDFFVNSELEHSNKVVENKPSDDIVTTPKKKLSIEENSNNVDEIKDSTTSSTKKNFLGKLKKVTNSVIKNDSKNKNKASNQKTEENQTNQVNLEKNDNKNEKRNVIVFPSPITLFIYEKTGLTIKESKLHKQKDLILEWENMDFKQQKPYVAKCYADKQIQDFVNGYKYYKTEGYL